MQNRQKRLLLLTQNQQDYPIHSRVHPLKVAPDCYIKREDELGTFVSGPKIRKYRSMISAIKKRGDKEVSLVGSSRSNHLLGLSMLLIENGITPKLHMLESKSGPPVGNALFIELLVPKKDIHLVPRNMWHERAEGGLLEEAIFGLVTLALDILQNEEDLGITFSNILIDSGSGLTAAALIASYGFLKKEATIHVMQTALSEEAFLDIVDRAKTLLEEALKEKIDQLPQICQHRPTTARSFGSTNALIFNTIASTARQEGFFLDPIYSAKLYLLLQDLLKKGALEGPTLFIHSGGLMTLAGFQKELQKTVDS